MLYTNKRINWFIYTCIIFGLLILFSLKIISYSYRVIFEQAQQSNLKDYNFVDVDGTPTSCRCHDREWNKRRLFWPPIRNSDLLCADGTYDLTLCIDSPQEDAPTPLELRLAELLSEDERLKRSKFMSNLNMWYQAESTTKRTQYSMYPSSVSNMKSIIDAISNGSSVHTKPITNPNIRLLQTSKKVCSPDDSEQKYDFVVIYKSGIYNFDDRQRIRQQYAALEDETDIRIGIVFSVGMPKDDGSNLFPMNGFSIQLPERAGETLKKWKGRGNEALQLAYEEARVYDDLIIGDYIDSYVNLTYKLITSQRWASAFCKDKTDVFLFLDDDYNFNPRPVLAYLRTMTKEKRAKLLKGSMMTWRKVIRPFSDPSRNKWAVTENDVPWPRYPPFAWGVSVFIGVDVLHDLVITTSYTRFLWIDDAFLGFAVAKLDYEFQEMKGFYLESNNNQKALVTHAPFRVSLHWILDNIAQFVNNLNIF